MIRGYYTAASGIVTQEKKLNAIANNIANVSTAGYKKDDLVLSTFGEHIAVRMNTYNQNPLYRLGNSAWMQTVEGKYTNYNQGGFEYTARSVDMGIQGDGFFVIDTPDGERLTRDGQFALDEEGYLFLPMHGRVQGENGDIQIGDFDFTVTADGYVLRPPEEDGEEPIQIDRILLAVPNDYDYWAPELAKDASGLFTSPGHQIWPDPPEGRETSIIRQYNLERSNVDMTEEMTRMLASQRSLQAASQLVKMYDDMADQANTRISRVQ